MSFLNINFKDLFKKKFLIIMSAKARFILRLRLVGFAKGFFVAWLRHWISADTRAENDLFRCRFGITFLRERL